MKITHHKNGEIKTLVEEAPYHPGYEDAGFKPKAVNNKPVAWIAIGDNTSVFFDLDTALSIDDNPTPLYTHPVKELTDEEILNEWLLTNYNPKTYVWANNTDDDLVLQFAKAILKKAQEK